MSNIDDLLDPTTQGENKTGSGDLPNATATLVLGILSIVLCIFYGIFGLILGIIAMGLHSSDKRLYEKNPAYYEQSFKNAKAGFICGIIGTSLSALFIIFLILAIIANVRF